MEGFTFTAVITGVLCYCLGLVFGWVFNRLNTADKMKEAYKKGEAAATEEAAREKAEIGEELQDKLRGMRDTLIESFEAYEQAVQSLDDRLAPGVKDQLSLDFTDPAERKQIGYKASSETSTTISSSPSSSSASSAKGSTSHSATSNGSEPKSSTGAEKQPSAHG